MNDYEYIVNAFTKDGEATNLEVDNLQAGCITSKNNKFELDSNGNLTVKTLLAETIMAPTIINTIYPIGSIYMSTNIANPSTLFGGQWEQIKDRFLLSAGDTYANGTTGGSAVNKLMMNNLPGDTIVSTSSGVNKSWCTGHWDNYSNYAYPTTNIGSSNLGCNKEFSILPPYLTVYMWKRIS